MRAVGIRSPPKLPGLLGAAQCRRWRNQTLFLEPELFPPAPPLPYLYIFHEENGAEFLHELQFLGGPHAQLGLLRLGPPSQPARPAASQIRGCRVDSSEAGEHGKMNGSTPWSRAPGRWRDPENGLLEETGSAFLAAAVLLWVEKCFCLGVVNQRKEVVYFSFPQKNSKPLICPLMAVSWRVGNRGEFHSELVIALLRRHQLWVCRTAKGERLAWWRSLRARREQLPDVSVYSAGVYA